LTAELIQRLFLPTLGNDVLGALEDQAVLRLASLSSLISTHGNLSVRDGAFVSLMEPPAR
jgi:hypothetical protein